MTHSDVIDVVNPFWYTPNRDGTLRAGPGAENAVEIAAWREAGMPIIPSLHAGDPALITDPALRETHIAAIVDLARAHDYDGIDVDYEGFPVETRDDFSLFIEQARRRAARRRTGSQHRGARQDRRSGRVGRPGRTGLAAALGGGRRLRDHDL
ncbi:MAG: hypothetical protein HND48_00875 [Chloroflexi bacterium]|nr:hypothetical protein [Chloroflexota bacterium]